MAKRRQNGEGTIYQRSNGLWICEVTLGYDDNGKRIKKTVSSMDLEKLKKKLNDLRFYNDRDLVAEPSKYTVYEWCNVWLNTYKKSLVKPGTYDMYYNALNTHIRPVIGNCKLDKLNQMTVQRFVNNLFAQKNLSQSSLKKIVITLKQAYDKAIELNMLYTNPCKNISCPKKEVRKAVAFTSEEQQRFIDCCSENTDYNNLFVFAFNTGLRMGELLALTWNDYDAEENTISVNKNISSVRDYENGGINYVVGTPKTKSGERIVPLTKAAKNMIERQLENKNNSKDDNKKKTPFIFGNSVGKPPEKRNIYRAFNNLIEKAQITSKVTFHSFRHSFATRLIEKGADIKTVSELLGHKSIQITLDIYGHVGKDLKKKTVALLN